MSKHKAIAFEKPEEFSDPIHDLIRSGARRLIQSAIEAELQSLLDGHQAVVRNGYLPERELQTGIGPVPVCCGFSIISYDCLPRGGTNSS